MNKQKAQILLLTDALMEEILNSSNIFGLTSTAFTCIQMEMDMWVLYSMF